MLHRAFRQAGGYTHFLGREATEGRQETEAELQVRQEVRDALSLTLGFPNLIVSSFLTQLPGTSCPADRQPHSLCSKAGSTSKCGSICLGTVLALSVLMSDGEKNQWETQVNDKQILVIRM